MTRSFAVVPPGKATWVTLLVAGAMLPLTILALVLVSSDGRLLASLRLPHLIGVGVILVAIGLVWLALRRLHVDIVDRMLVVRGAIYTRKVSLQNLDGATARILDLERGSEWRPRIRMNGFDLPGVHIGHYRGRPFKRKLFCLLTSKRRVLLLPERDGEHFLLLSLQRPQALVEALDQTGLS